MARLAKLVLPEYPHHITQRGNRRQDVFFEPADYEYYLELLRQWCIHEGIEIWAYCLMTNPIHLMVMPKKKSNLGKASKRSASPLYPDDQFPGALERLSLAGEV